MNTKLRQCIVAGAVIALSAVAADGIAGTKKPAPKQQTTKQATPAKKTAAPAKKATAKPVTKSVAPAEEKCVMPKLPELKAFHNGEKSVNDMTFEEYKKWLENPAEPIYTR